MSKIAKEDIKYASSKVEGIAESYRVYPTLLKKQIDDALKNERRLNNSDEKKQLEDYQKRQERTKELTEKAIEHRKELYGT